MATQDLLRLLTARGGASQADRDDPRLSPRSAPLDDRDTAGLLAALRAIAPLVQHYGATTTPTGADWSAWFPAGDAAALAALVARSDGRVAPHLGLLIAFLRLSARPQALLNDITARHLAFQMQQVLGFRPDAPVPDRAHLVIELKKGSAPLLVDPTHRFTAGKDATRVEQLYAPVREVVVGAARVERLCGVARAGARLVFAPVADSADGLGAPLTGDAPHWPPFGRATWPVAPVGFAVASPLLRLAQGQRRIELLLRLAGLPAGIDAQALAASFEAHLTGPKDWIGPSDLHGTLAGDVLTLALELPAAEPAVADHDPAVHLLAFPAGAPVLQLLLRPDAAFGPAALAAVTLRSVQVRVAASGVRGLTLENDQSTLDAKKAFLPFGAQPVVGSRFFVGCPEALAKRLTALSVRLVWQGAPASLPAWYDGYTRAGQFSNGVSATLTWQDAGGATTTSAPLDLMNRSNGATTLGLSTPPVTERPLPSARVAALQQSGSGTARTLGMRQVLARPVRAAALANVSGGPATRSAPRAGFVTVTLLEDFLHGDFRRESVAAILDKKPPLNEPYTPKVQEITLDYAAQSDLSRIDEPAADAFTDTEVQFFQVDAFGPAREHAWLTQARPWAPQGGVALLPAHAAAGELFIGLSGVRAGDAVSLLLQVAEGSADPLATPQRLQWSVLADDAWRALNPGELALDTTRDLRVSGLVAAVLPRETSVAHTRMPPGLVWLRATTGDARAACDLVGVQANAVEVQFVDQGNDPARLATPLPAAAIAKATPPLAAVKAVAQPYASFGGTLAETDAALARRAAEWLRHRNRAITGWDCERLVLQAFPAIHRARCIPHASADSWLAAGHLMVVVVPDLRGRNAVDALQPRADLDTLERIRSYLVARSGPQARVTVRNPGYRPVTLDFAVRLRPGFGFNFYRGAIDDALQRALSPWAFGGAASPGFGGRVLRSALLATVESLPYVDFVTDFRMTLDGDVTDHAEIVADAPDAILVSAASHRIREVVDA